MPDKDGKIRLLIVDDSVFFRKTLTDALAGEPSIKVIGTAVDAMDAMEKIQTLKPDVVTLDVEMPKLNGIDFLRKLMPVHPLPVVVVSSAPIRVLDALSAGAVEFVRKPEIKGPDGMRSFMTELTVKIRIASAAKVVRRAQPKPAAAGTIPGGGPVSAVVSTPTAPKAPGLVLRRGAFSGEAPIIAIGASTGGTEAILEVVRELPANTPGVIIVQHMPPVFTRMYAQRLDRICHMSVKEAEPGDRVEQGKIIIGAGEYHLRLAKDVKGYYVRSEKGPKVSGHCPSVDVLFDSVAEVAKANAMGILLTGMGADGAKGLLKMHQAGAYTVGQDKETCVVYGMPAVAFKMGAVQKQLPLGEMGGEIIRYLMGKK